MGFSLTSPAPEKCDPTAKNRVWGFFGEQPETSRQNRPQSLQPRRENRPTTTKVASGRTYWPSRDPIGEAGGINLYGMVGNDAVNWWDYLGLQAKQPAQKRFKTWVTVKVSGACACQCEECEVIEECYEVSGIGNGVGFSNLAGMGRNQAFQIAIKEARDNAKKECKAACSLFLEGGFEEISVVEMDSQAKPEVRYRFMDPGNPPGFQWFEWGPFENLPNAL